MDNHQSYLVDRWGNAVPVGVPGEICIGGVGLARGYLGQPGLTADRFVPDRFGAPGARLYRSGDLGVYRADGEIVFLGRIDDQVKIRGLRVELEEIEAVLASHPRIRQAAVAVYEPQAGDKRLVAYVVSEPGAPVPTAELREHLGGELPDYMVPATFMALDALPLTPSGKVNRRALPEPEAGRGLDSEYIAPRTETEELLASKIFGSVLGVDQVGVQDSFFDLGGNSLQATQVVSRIRETFNADINLRTLYAASSVESLARLIQEVQEGGEDDPLRQQLEDEIAGLSEEEAIRLLESSRQGDAVS
jgi:acyl carrier protein